ncbi:MAG: LytR/AlgR family response regulator transcription factor [Gemmatimonadota bacterium]
MSDISRGSALSNLVIGGPEARRILLVDDEETIRLALSKFLRSRGFAVETADTGMVALGLLKQGSYSLMLCDIRMPGMSGLELAASRERGRPLVVFVTAYESYALPAYDVEPVDYITKPVVQERLDRAVQRVRERLGEMAAAPARHLVARVRDRDVIVRLDEIDYIEADDVYAAVHGGGKRLLVRRSLDALERDLDARFLRVHRRYIVRLDTVTAVRQPAGGTRELLLADGAAIPVSRRRWDEVEEALRAREIGGRG